MNIIVGSLAQLVEQLTFNQLVTGSNPVRPTTINLHDNFFLEILDSSIAQLVEQMTVNHWVTGSSPVRGAIRSIAQSGSAPALGAGCREFESLYSDHCLLMHERAVSSVGRAVDF